MAYPIEKKLVVAVASSALFDLTDSDRIFREHGEDKYRAYQRDHENEVLKPGVAFPLIRRLLGVNGDDDDDKPVEVVLLSRNDPDTGLRVLKSIQTYDLDISRAVFVKGRNPFVYMNALNACLFLSANEDDVKRAVQRGLPAGRVFPTEFLDNQDEKELRIAFDFDGILADDTAEAFFQREGLERYLASEQEQADDPLVPGPLHRFLTEISVLQERELKRKEADPTYEPRIRVAIITARNAPAHERVVKSLRKWGIQVDEAFFLGGIEKRRILEEFKPHIFFDDQLRHVEGAARVSPSVHVPFGVSNNPTEEEVREAQVENERRKGERKE
jgi:5'-nucleotidase